MQSLVMVSFSSFAVYLLCFGRIWEGQRIKDKASKAQTLNISALVHTTELKHVILLLYHSRLMSDVNCQRRLSQKKFESLSGKFSYAPLACLSLRPYF